MPVFIPPEMWPLNLPDMNPADYSLCGVPQDRGYHSWIHDVKVLKEHLLMEWRLLDHSIMVAATAHHAVA